jgi:hypothetical protein
VPQPLLPEALRDRNAIGVTRRVQRRLTTEDIPAEDLTPKI